MSPRILSRICAPQPIQNSCLALLLLLLFPNAYSPRAADSFSAPLPPGVKTVWDLDKAYHEATSTRERISLNGLWRWQPAESSTETVPAGNWGFFKVPGCWPGITDYMQKDSQTLHTHPSWSRQSLRSVTSAWYQREFTVPAHWTGRQVTAQFEYLNSYAVIYVDGRRIGELRFPGGELDLTAVCQPGSTHLLSLFVAALPLKAVLLSYTDSASAREVKGSVARRGLCGDVGLLGAPPGPRIADIRVDTSVRRAQVTINVALDSTPPGHNYSLQARIIKNGLSIQQFPPHRFLSNGLSQNRLSFTEPWKPDTLWDLHTPQACFSLDLALLDSEGRLLDAALPVRFGFREFWIDGRDFYLNGSRIFLSAVPLDNAQVSAALATYTAARESLLRLKSFGINFVYTHNYGCEPGSHLSFTELLRAADDVGILVSLSQPHFSQYDWLQPDAAQNNGYARHAAFYVRAAQNHPSVVFYSMSHNATGYSEDMNPDLIDGLNNPRDSWASKNAALALRADHIVKQLDPSRIVYHHASGNLGSMHPINFYPNFVPVQELSDWFEHWATTGIKPAFTCEFGAPFTWDWTMYRGWYNGQREFGSAQVPWEFCLAEWNAQFFGPRAYQISEPEKANLRWEAAQFRAGRLWHRWDYPFQVGSTEFEERYPVFALYLNDNWRSFRAWGVSAISPWEYGHFWKLRPGADKRRQNLPVDYENLQKPGFSPDFIDQRYERFDLAFEKSDWIPTPAALALLNNNLPTLAFIGGPPARFTAKDHNFLPGDTIEKQLIILNNSRQTLTCQSHWSLALPQPLTGHSITTLPTGQQHRIPLRFDLPNALPPGTYSLNARFQFSNGHSRNDAFSIHLLAPPAHQSPPLTSPPQTTTVSTSKTLPFPPKIALFDPPGHTAKLLNTIGTRFTLVDPGSDLSPFDILLVGQSALTPSSPAPDISRVHTGLKVLLFEQTSETLEKRFGFRVVEYGLRQVFPRVPNHPILAGITSEHLRDWRGEATLLPPRLHYEMRPRFGPTVLWCDLPVTRLWRCGNRGNVASVLIEKPTRGDFLPILDGGFSLQFSPLLEHPQGQGLLLFSQLDLTARTENDPAAHRLLLQLLAYVSTWQPPPQRPLLYAGHDSGLKHLQSLGLTPHPFTSQSLNPNHLLVIAPDEIPPAIPSQKIAEFLKSGGHLLAIGFNQENANALLPFKISIAPSEHIAAFFEPFPLSSPFAGLSPADVHNRAPRPLPLLIQGSRIFGNGILGTAEDDRVTFSQIAPWQFAPSNPLNLKRTHRRVSFLLSRLLANLGAAGLSPIVERFSKPVDPLKSEQHWLHGLYLDQPEEWDDPYRFFRW